jgi:uncharacterized protein with GYD domain
MLTFVMLTRLSPDAARTPSSLEDLELAAMERIRSECPEVTWLQNLAVLGSCDYVDIFQAPDVDTAMRVAVIIRTFGHASTEVMTGTEWGRFKEMVRSL